MTSILIGLTSFGKEAGCLKEKYMISDTFKTITLQAKFVRLLQAPKCGCWSSISSTSSELNVFEVESFFQNQWVKKIVTIVYPGCSRNNFVAGKNYKIIAKLDEANGDYVSMATIPAPPKKKYF